MKKLFTVWLIACTASVNFFFTTKPDIPPSQKTEQYFKQKLSVAISKLAQLQAAVNSNKSNVEIQETFRRARSAYKQLELLIEYYYPSLIRKVNGSALPFADGENSLAIQQPQGFQVIEEMLFPVFDKKKSTDLQRQIQLLKQIFTGILKQQDPYNFQDKFIFDAVSFEIYRLISLGITGFDSPVAFNSMREAAAVIESITQVVNIYIPGIKDLSFAKQLNGNLDAAKNYLLQHRDFNSFDRLYFITNYADPLSEKITALKKRLNLVLPEERRILSSLAPHLFAVKYYNPSGYSPNAEADATPAKILLGKKLFFDPVLSINNQRSCATCHQPAKAFTDGLAKSLSLDNINSVSRNAPTLWNAAFQPKQFYDSRAVFMERQVFEVIHNEKEMGGSLSIILQRIKGDSSYQSLFENAYADSVDLINEDHFTNAIASYLRSLISLNSRFDKYVNGNKSSLNEEEKKGFNLFMGKAKCATCHYVPLFNGVAPPYFSESESEVLGVPATNDTLHPMLDEDEGKYNLYPISILRYAFKTPTLRNIALTAPYMHNGVYNTLEEVIDFYDKGGGAGLGIAPVNQTLPANKLNLSVKEKKQLIAFLESLSDTAGVEGFNKP
ncbi:MAG: cytochrome c peroxidase [Bacteroidota bacterium]